MPETEQVSVSDELAAAQADAAGPRRQVAQLESALRTAVAEGRFSDAQDIQTDLAAAREVAAVTDAKFTALRAAAAQLAHDRAADAQEIAEAQQRHRAEQDLAAARADEQKHVTALDAATAALWESLATASQRYRDVGAADEAVTAARHRQKTAQAALGAWPAHHPGPAVNRSSRAQTLVDSDPLISQLVRWSPK